MRRRGEINSLDFGVDSSNHGTDPEIFVAVASKFPVDSKIYPQCEQIRSSRRIHNFLKKRDYRFMIVSRNHYELYGNHNLLAYVLRDLISAFPYFSREKYFPICIYMDGEMRKAERNLAKKLISQKLIYPYSLISVKEVPKEKINKTNTLIAIADGQAHNLFRNKTLDELTQGNLSSKRVVLR